MDEMTKKAIGLKDINDLYNIKKALEDLKKIVTQSLPNSEIQKMVRKNIKKLLKIKKVNDWNDSNKKENGNSD
jgi:hypothetical protein